MYTQLVPCKTIKKRPVRQVPTQKLVKTKFQIFGHEYTPKPIMSRFRREGLYKGRVYKELGV